jgi:hypothetical protein
MLALSVAQGIFSPALFTYRGRTMPKPPPFPEIVKDLRQPIMALSNSL